MSSRLLILSLAACTATARPLPPVRFANAPAAQMVNDRRDVPRAPQERVHMRALSNFDGQFFRRLTRTLELRRTQRARGVNALDEVPSSTWFTNRIGARSMTPDEIKSGPGGVGSPEHHLPWTIVSTKVGGVSVGFIVKDARGEKWLVKFDQVGFPEAETATHVIAGRLMWAFGFNVTEDYVAYIHRDDLVLSKDAVIKDVFGEKRPLDEAALAERLARVEIGGDGRLRVLASHWLAGKPLGTHSAEGVRSDDPNDLIPHELRRDLRGAYALFSWLDHIDIHGGNFLDMWTSDPGDSKRHYVKHYLIDFGIALGFGARKNSEARFGHEHYLDYSEMTRSFLSFGLVSRDWTSRTDTKMTGAGNFEVDTYDPGAWKSTTPWYVPIYDADRIDKFWASKILIRFTRAHIRAAVDAGRLSDERVASWLTDTLIARQRKTARYWFERVNPIDRVALDGTRLCFTDLSITYGFARARGTRYAIELHDRAGRLAKTIEILADNSGVSCAPIELAPGDDRYTIVRITTRRPTFTGSTDIHLALEPTARTPRVIGIWRP